MRTHDLASSPTVEVFAESAGTHVPRDVRNIIGFIGDVAPAVTSVLLFTPLRTVLGEVACRPGTLAAPAATRPAIPIKHCFFCAELIHAATIACNHCDRDQRFW
jgi:hypothetical protein